MRLRWPPPGSLLVAGCALLFFWAASLAHSYAHQGKASLSAALAIVSAKGCIAAVVLLHLRGARVGAVLALLAGIATLALLATFHVSDALAR